MADAEDQPQKDERTGRFLTGNNGGGRPKGSRNKLGEAFIEDLLNSWEAHGSAVIMQVIAEKPDQYLKVIASILPKDLNVNINNMDDLTDEQLIQRIRHLDAAIRPFLDVEGASGASGGVGPETAH